MGGPINKPAHQSQHSVACRLESHFWLAGGTIPFILRYSASCP